MDDGMDEGRNMIVAQPQQQLVSVAPTSMAGLLGVEERRQIAEVMARMMKAQLAPRGLRMTQLQQQVLNECTATGLAEIAVYQYARGGTEVSGPSIRLVEMISNHWGNIDSGIQILHRGRDDQGHEFSEARAEAMDLETGRRDYRDFVVKHWRDTKRGGYAITDERDIAELIYSQGQRRKRACLLSLLPRDLVDQAVAQCERTLSADPALSSKDALLKLVQAFAPMGVTQKQIETFCQCNLEAIRPAQVVRLRKIWVSINDGMSSPETWFAEAGAWDQVEQRHEETRTRRTVAKDEKQQNPKPETKRQQARQTPEPPRGEATEGAADAPAGAAPAAAPSTPPEPPATAQAPAFEYLLLDAGGEPLGDDMWTDPMAFLEALTTEMRRPGANEIGLREQNADAIEDALELDDCRAFWDGLHGTEEEPPQAEELQPLDRSAGWPSYLRAFTDRMKEATADNYYDICAIEFDSVSAAPSSIKLNLVKRSTERAAQLGISPAEFKAQQAPAEQVEQEQQQKPAAPADKDLGYCEAHCQEMMRLTSVDALRRFVQHAAVSRRYQAWKASRPELAKMMEDTQREAEEKLKAAA